MKNLKKRVFTHKSKSKIFITILCIFGLLFSWSCSCKNRVSDPNETPISGGTNKDPDPTPPPTPNNDPDKDLLNGALSTSSTTVIVVASAGDSIKTTSTIKFKNATAKLTAIADVDASANTTLALDDFDYTGTTLTFKKDTTDTSKYDATALAKVSWSGESKKVKATFELTPTSANATLTKTTQEVEIEIGKVLKVSSQNLFKDADTGLQFQENNHTFMIKLGTLSSDGLVLTLKDSNSDKETSGGDVSINNFKRKISDSYAANSTHYQKYFDGIDWISHTLEDYEYTKSGSNEKVNKAKGKLILKLRFKLKPVKFAEFEDAEYTIEVPLEGKGNWVEN